MGFDQYHEPAAELPDETRTFARLCASLTEEAEAIGWYEQRMAVEPDRQALAIMRDAQGEEFKHFSMDLEFLLRRTPLWREIAEGILFQDGDIVEHGEEAEEEAVEGAAARGAADIQRSTRGEAAHQIASAENRAVFHGWEAAGIAGIADVATHDAIPLGSDCNLYPAHVAKAVEALLRAGVDGPYGLALGPA